MGPKKEKISCTCEPYISRVQPGGKIKERAGSHNKENYVHFCTQDTNLLKNQQHSSVAFFSGENPLCATYYFSISLTHSFLKSKESPLSSIFFAAASLKKRKYKERTCLHENTSGKKNTWSLTSFSWGIHFLERSDTNDYGEVILIANFILLSPASLHRSFIICTAKISYKLYAHMVKKTFFFLLRPTRLKNVCGEKNTFFSHFACSTCKITMQYG